MGVIAGHGAYLDPLLRTAGARPPRPLCAPVLLARRQNRRKVTLVSPSPQIDPFGPNCGRLRAVYLVPAPFP